MVLIYGRDTLQKQGVSFLGEDMMNEKMKSQDKWAPLSARHDHCLEPSEKNEKVLAFAKRVCYY